MDDDLNTSSALATLFDLAKPLRALANRLERGDDVAIPDSELHGLCLLYTSPSPRDVEESRMPSSA